MAIAQQSRKVLRRRHLPDHDGKDSYAYGCSERQETIEQKPVSAAAACCLGPGGQQLNAHSHDIA